MDSVELARSVLGSLAAALGLSDVAHSVALDVVLGRTPAEGLTRTAGLALGVTLGQWGRLGEIGRELRSRRRELWFARRRPPLAPALADLRLATLAFVVAVSIRWVLARLLGDAGSLSATAVGVGLSAVSVALASLPILPEARSQPPEWLGPFALGVAQGAAIFPGASVLGLGVLAIALLGVPSKRAVEAALLATVPHLLLDFARAGAPIPPVGPLLEGTLGALLGTLALRRLASTERLPWVGAWGLAVGLALVAFGRAS